MSSGSVECEYCGREFDGQKGLSVHQTKSCGEDHQPWNDKEVLNKLLSEKGLTSVEAASELDCSPTTIRRSEKRFGIKSIQKERTCDFCGREFDSMRGLSIHQTRACGENMALWNDEDLLYELYIEENMTQEEVAGELGCCSETVQGSLTDFDIKKRRDAPWHDSERLRERYVEQEMGLTRLAELWGCAPSTIRLGLVESDIEHRNGPPTGEDHHAWVDVEMRECVYCGGEYRPDPYEAGQSRFCSKGCQYVQLSDDWSGEGNPNYKPRVFVPCTYCGSALEREQWDVETGRNIFCDDKNCRASWRAEYLSGENNPNYNSADVSCSWCGEKLTRAQHRIDSQEYFFCTDKRCQSQWRSANYAGRDHPMWRGGSSIYHAVLALLPDSWYSVKEAVRERDRDVCELCGEEATTERHPVHHVVPILSGGGNSLETSITLCRSCHPQVEKFTRELAEPLLRDWTDDELPEGRERWTPEATEPTVEQATMDVFTAADD